MDQHKTGAWAAGQIDGQPEKPLGRGLEDISHLFLSKRPEEHHLRPHAVLLQPRTSVNSHQLAAMLRLFEGALEEGLKGIDACVPCHPCGEIDLLALDRTNRLTIIDFDTAPNDALLLRGIGHFDWVVHNIPIVRRMYAGRAINFTGQPRLFLIAPQFSSLLKRVVRRIALQIDCVRYRVVDMSEGPAILFERVIDE